MIARTPSPLADARADLTGRRAAVVGAGKTGLSAVRFLRAAGARVALTDTRADPPALADPEAKEGLAEIALGGLDGSLLARQELVVVSPGVPLAESAIRAAAAAGVPVIGDVELFGRYAGAPVVAITGSNGKSTVTTLVGAMFEAAGRSVRVGGNLGTPALQLLDDHVPEAYVLEVSSFQAEGLDTFRPQVGVLLNLSADHLDRYPDERAYYAAKLRLFANMGAGDVAVLNGDDPEVRGHAGRLPAEVRRVWFGTGAPEPGDAGLTEENGARWLALGGTASPEPVLPERDWPLVGAPNRLNALAALAAGRAAGLEDTAMARAMRGFGGLPHRMEPVATVGGVRYVNDSKGTNLGAVASALEGLEGRWVWIAGGVNKGGDFIALRPVLAAHCREAVLIGEASAEIADAVADVVPVHQANDMRAAVRRAAKVARPGDTVVLSPGCTSFDQYPNFEARGEDFRAAVATLEAQHALR
ncbi:UDP-N-acetylmuramoyl-L-alanine--D-glutamate ligase [Thiohalorhabdus methylotrophus]|uniref:UDP-N-acetylmuramoylalanine--D-glutamate ligase n=1 Tax=Thiohalorhabdus methylotrophus TaxID=3242694 RepID=A0ABV4TWB9_9GAMM